VRSYRPYIPLRVRVAVAERQALDFVTDQWWDHYNALLITGMTHTTRLYLLLEALFGGEDVELDHNPALSQRKYNPSRRKYIPDANDPRYLTYRLKANHLQKTTGRKPGAARTVTTKGSDVWLAKKYRKQERPKKSKSKIPSRPFPKAKRRLGHSKSSFATRAGKGF
jgi:hypothetical protein